MTEPSRTGVHGDPVPAAVDIHRAFTLKDGTAVELRPLLAVDEPAYRAFTRILSPESQYLRFFMRKGDLSEREIDRFVHVDYIDRFALIAVRGDEIVAIARYDRELEGDTTDQSEVAFIVRDDLQGNGIGPALLGVLAEVAHRNGVRQFNASVLPHNRPMLKVFEKSGWVTSRRFADGAVYLVMALPRADPA